MTNSQRETCHLIIHGAAASTGAIGAGLAQLPMADHFAMIPIQIGMIVGLGKVFNVELTDAAARGIALSMAGSYVGRAASQVLVGWIPVIGNAINASTAAGITEAMGWAVVKKFEKGEIAPS